MVRSLADAPDMRVIPVDILEKLGRIPEYKEHVTVGALEALERCGADHRGFPNGESTRLSIITTAHSYPT